MEVKAHFSNIHRVIINHLKEAKEDITAAVAWFTDPDIFNALCKQAQMGTRVSIALLGDSINKSHGALNFSKLSHLGGQITFLPAGSRAEPLMHHKFCVIDFDKIITGSYNWSIKARTNNENITVISDASELAGQFLESFDGLVAHVGVDRPVQIDGDAARRRLELIRNLILLNEQEEVTLQLKKLRLAAGLFKFEHIIAALEVGAFKPALDEIDIYLRRASALVVADQIDIMGLRLQLRIMELRLNSISDEKSELERRLISFNRRHDEALGDIIRRLLQFRVRLAWLRAHRNAQEATSAASAKDEAEAAERAYREYSEHQEDLKCAAPLSRLSEVEERDLKSTYRKACMLCHPDKVSDPAKEAAQLAFQNLQRAYQSNNLIAVKEIYAALQSGQVLHSRSTILTAADSLRAAIAELERALGDRTREFFELQSSDGMRLMEVAGTNDSEWNVFFQQQRVLLMQELCVLETELASEDRSDYHV